MTLPKLKIPTFPVVELAFDPFESDPDSMIAAIFTDEITAAFWGLGKRGTITDQYFSRSCLAASFAFLRDLENHLSAAGLIMLLRTYHLLGYFKPYLLEGEEDESFDLETDFGVLYRFLSTRNDVEPGFRSTRINRIVYTYAGDVVYPIRCSGSLLYEYLGGGEAFDPDDPAIEAVDAAFLLGLIDNGPGPAQVFETTPKGIYVLRRRLLIEDEK